MLTSPLKKSNINNILIRATNWVGDAVMTLPALEAVRENFPAASITVLARPWVAPLFENHPAVNNILIYNRHDGLKKNVTEFFHVSNLIRKNRYDLAILFQNAFEAALLVYLGRVIYRLGFASDGRGLLLTHGIKRSSEIFAVHQVEYYLSILKAAGLKAESRNPVLYLSEKDLAKAENLLQLKGIGKNDFILGISPGAIFGNAKRWPFERFAEISDRASERWGAKVIILGSKKEKDIGNKMAGLMKNKAADFCGTTSLGEAMGLISKCSYFVTNDSGLMHVAAALGVPTFAIFGSTDHVATGPRGSKTKIIRHDIACSPCLKSECPTDFKCMLSIEPEEVWDEMEKFRNNAQL
ncbi:MAG: lipopolysaccharide heptosyltransferase II [Proteobacteria bacterium]|nr:lipopolysaccharide heptosyltransferase II [Pseudomonadota bacterium]